MEIGAVIKSSAASRGTLVVLRGMHQINPLRSTVAFGRNKPINIILGVSRVKTIKASEFDNNEIT